MGDNKYLPHYIFIAVALAALLWGVKLLELAMGIDLYQLGVYPRTQSGLVGIITGPVIHSSWEHLIGNTFPLVLLGSMLIYGYPKSGYWALVLIWLFSGAAVWLFARTSYHLGSSGLTHGIFFYLFLGGILRRDRRSAALLMVAFYLYGGMLLSILPNDPAVSFESHFFGAAAGAICAYVFRNWDPKALRKRYAWQSHPDEPGDPEEHYDPIIGEQWRLNDQAADTDTSASTRWQ